MRTRHVLAHGIRSSRFGGESPPLLLCQCPAKFANPPPFESCYIGSTCSKIRCCWANLLRRWQPLSVSPTRTTILSPCCLRSTTNHQRMHGGRKMKGVKKRRSKDVTPSYSSRRFMSSPPLARSPRAAAALPNSVTAHHPLPHPFRPSVIRSCRRFLLLVRRHAGSLVQ